MINALSIYNQAEEIVQLYKTRDPSEIAEALDIDIHFNEFEELLGVYTCICGHRVIVLNSLMSEELYRMVLGHELGHDILHRLGATSKNGVADFKEFSMTCKTGTLEYEANAFCAHLLISNDDFLENAQYGLNIETMASIFCVDPNLIVIKGKELQKMGYDIKNCDEYNSCFLKNVNPF